MNDGRDGGGYDCERRMKMEDKVLTITREKMLEAAATCSTAEGVFKKLWPDEFSHEWEEVENDDIHIIYCFSEDGWDYREPLLFDKKAREHFWKVGCGGFYMAHHQKYEYKLEKGKFFRRKK